MANIAIKFISNLKNFLSKSAAAACHTVFMKSPDAKMEKLNADMVIIHNAVKIHRKLYKSM